MREVGAVEHTGRGPEQQDDPQDALEQRILLDRLATGDRDRADSALRRFAELV